MLYSQRMRMIHARELTGKDRERAIQEFMRWLQRMRPERHEPLALAAYADHHIKHEQKRRPLHQHYSINNNPHNVHPHRKGTSV